jgi:hypothetical protein
VVRELEDGQDAWVGRSALLNGPKRVELDACLNGQFLLRQVPLHPGISNSPSQITALR